MQVSDDNHSNKPFRGDVLIFGAGQAGQLAINVCHRLGLNVKAILDNNGEKWGSQVSGILIESPDVCFSRMENDIPVIVASQYENEIVEQLTAMNVCHIISIGDLSKTESTPAKDFESSNVYAYSKNKSFYKRHSGERCFILATGPSINNQDLSVLSNEYCISVSMFFLHELASVIKPKYHVGAPWHAPFDFDSIRTYLSQAKKYSYPDVHYFFGHRSYQYSLSRFFEKYPETKLNNYSFVNYDCGISLNENNYLSEFLWDISGSPFSPRTSVYMAIQVAFYMGFKDIYLIGVDHDYLDDVKRVEGHHFYDESNGVSDVEHLSQFNTERWFKEYYLRWRDYRLMSTYLTRHGVNIYNATDGGMLDVFPRVKFEELF